MFNKIIAKLSNLVVVVMFCIGMPMVLGIMMFGVNNFVEFLNDIILQLS